MIEWECFLQSASPHNLSAVTSLSLYHRRNYCSEFSDNPFLASLDSFTSLVSVLWFYLLLNFAWMDTTCILFYLFLNPRWESFVLQITASIFMDIWSSFALLSQLIHWDSNAKEEYFAFVEEYLTCFQFWVIISNPAVNVLVHISWCTHTWVSLGHV